MLRSKALFFPNFRQHRGDLSRYFEIVRRGFDNEIRQSLFEVQRKLTRLATRKLLESPPSFNGAFQSGFVTCLDENYVIDEFLPSNFEKQRRVNHDEFAFMKLFREEKGKSTITVIESDEYIPDEAVSDLLANEQVSSVDVIEI